MLPVFQNRYRSMLKKKEDKSCHERKHRHTLPEKRPKLRWPELEVSCPLYILEYVRSLITSLVYYGKRQAQSGSRTTIKGVRS